MKSWLGYKGHFMHEVRTLRMTLLEKALIASLVLMCLVSAVSTMIRKDVGNYEQLKLAKQQAQQELMALRTNRGE
jgi:hypothetical protein